MCGRGSSHRSVDELANEVGAVHTVNANQYRPRYNAAPATHLPVLTLTPSTSTASSTPQGGQSNDLTLHFMKWGLMTSHIKKSEHKLKPQINARAESIATKPSFKHLIHRNRCVLLLDGFYEWKRDGDTKKPQPFFIHMPETADKASYARTLGKLARVNTPSLDLTDSSVSSSPKKVNKYLPPLMYIAALYDVNLCTRKDNTTFEEHTFAIVTTASNKVMNTVHDRMPVILSPDYLHAWLNCDQYSIQQAAFCLPPYDNGLTLRRVCDAVNSVKNQGKDCMLPLEEAKKERASKGLGRFFGMGSNSKTASTVKSSPFHRPDLLAPTSSPSKKRKTPDVTSKGGSKKTKNKKDVITIEDSPTIVEKKQKKSKSIQKSPFTTSSSAGSRSAFAVNTESPFSKAKKAAGSSNSHSVSKTAPKTTPAATPKPPTKSAKKKSGSLKSFFTPTIYKKK